MTEIELLKEIANHPIDIKELLAKQPAQGTARPSSFATPSAAQAEIPQPTELVDDPGSTVVFFGKNNGVALGKLSDRSVEWYATDQPPRLDSSGKPYPARPQEIALRNAARQLFHSKRGTLAGAPAQTRIERNMPPPARSAAQEQEDSQVPF